MNTVRFKSLIKTLLPLAPFFLLATLAANGNPPANMPSNFNDLGDKITGLICSAKSTTWKLFIGGLIIAIPIAALVYFIGEARNAFAAVRSVLVGIFIYIVMYIIANSFFSISGYC